MEDIPITLSLPALIAIAGGIGGVIMTLLKVIINNHVRQVTGKIAELENVITKELSTLQGATSNLQQLYHTLDKEVAVLIAIRERKSHE